MRKFFVILAALSLVVVAHAQGPDDQYVRIYNLIQEADALNKGDQPGPALTKYSEAQIALNNLQKNNPDWNSKVVAFRLSYLADKISVLSAKAPKAAAPSTATAQKAAPAGTNAPAPGLAVELHRPSRTSVADWENQISSLQGQVQQLQGERAVLEAKLKEALGVQPAAPDSGELAKAQAQISSLQKENESLKMTLAQQKSQPGSPADNRELEQTRKALADATRQLAEQRQTNDALVLERKLLQAKLANLPSGTGTAASETNYAATKRKLDDTTAKLQQQTYLATKLAQERDALQARLRNPGAATEVDALAALRAENQILKKQLADAKVPTNAPVGNQEAARKLMEAQVQIAALQSDKELLRAEKATLEDRLKQATATPATAAAMPAPSKAEERARVKQLEHERDDLQKKLNAALKELYGRKGKTAAARIDDLEGQLATARARLEIFEARQVPYSAEELALFKKPEPTLAEIDPKAGKKPISELPSAAIPLVAEAQRAFSARQLDTAEEKYAQVVKQDQKNPTTLANLATIQLERNRLDECDKTITQALALAPNDAYALSILGQLRFKQQKYEEALDALTRAAKIDPKNPRIQNYLGITLGQKGMRGPAETALRKAIQLDPGYGDAHNNLAVIYLTQQPPLVELARWHYQKALAAGNPHNPALEKVFDEKTTALGEK